MDSRNKLYLESKQKLLTTKTSHRKTQFPFETAFMFDLGEQKDFNQWIKVFYMRQKLQRLK